MHADEIAELLEVNEEQAAAIREFIQNVGASKTPRRPSRCSAAYPTRRK